jgi:hypothetical protein
MIIRPELSGAAHNRFWKPGRGQNGWVVTAKCLCICGNTGQTLFQSREVVASMFGHALNIWDTTSHC